MRIRSKALSFGLLECPEGNLRAAEGEGHFCTVFACWKWGKEYDHKTNVEFSFDVAIIKKNPNGNYMRLVHNKSWNQYTWNEVPNSHQVKDKADEIKEEGLWQEVRDRYLEKKNMYLSWQDRNHPSFVVYVEAVNEVYNRYFNRGGGYNVQSIFRLR